MLTRVAHGVIECQLSDEGCRWCGCVHALPSVADGYFCGVNDVEQLLWVFPEVTVTLTFTG